MTPSERAEKIAIQVCQLSCQSPSDHKANCADSTEIIAAEIQAAVEEFIQRNVPDEYVRLKDAKAAAYEEAAKICETYLADDWEMHACGTAFAEKIRARKR